jgi:hypothetical protein
MLHFLHNSRRVDMKHESLYTKSYDAGTTTRLAIKRVVSKVADAGLAGITVVCAFGAAVAPKPKPKG